LGSPVAPPRAMDLPRSQILSAGGALGERRGGSWRSSARTGDAPYPVWRPYDGWVRVCIRHRFGRRHADVAQLVAHHLAKVRVAGSNPVVRSLRRLDRRAGPQKGPSGGLAEWLRQGPAKPCTRVRFPHPPRAIGAVGARFLDTEEVTGSNPVSPTSTEAMSHRRTWPLLCRYSDFVQLRLSIQALPKPPERFPVRLSGHLHIDLHGDRKSGVPEVGRGHSRVDLEIGEARHAGAPRVVDSDPAYARPGEPEVPRSGRSCAGRSASHTPS
jgi:hypothetical protein